MLPKRYHERSKIAMSIGKSKPYEQLLKKALKEEKEAIETKNWSELAKIRAKIVNFESKIKEIE